MCCAFHTLLHEPLLSLSHLRRRSGVEELERIVDQQLDRVVDGEGVLGSVLLPFLPLRRLAAIAFRRVRPETCSCRRHRS